MSHIIDYSAHKGLLAGPFLGREKGQERVILCRGNRTEVTVTFETRRPLVEKRLLSFADVSSERLALYREAVLQKAAQGRGVVPIIDGRFSGAESHHDLVRGEDEVNVISRDFIDGHSLRDLLGMPHLWEKERAVMWIRSLAATLSRVHELKGVRGEWLGLVHRDVTPGNVLIEARALGRPPDEEGVWLNDFGLAHVRAWGPLRSDETLQGAPRYLSPELRAGRSPSTASDVYQAALILCALLSAHQGTPLDALFRPTDELHRPAHELHRPAHGPLPAHGLRLPAHGLLQKGQSRSLNEHAYHLLTPWKAGAALDPHPENRPSAAELAALLGA